MVKIEDMINKVYDELQILFKDETIYCQGKNGVNTLVLFDEPELIPNKMSRYRIGTQTILVLKDDIPFLSIEVLSRGPTPPRNIAGVIPVHMVTRSVVINHEDNENLKYDLDELEKKMLLLIVVPDQSKDVKEAQFNDLDEKFRGVLNLKSEYTNVKDFAITPLRETTTVLKNLLKRNSIDITNDVVDKYFDIPENGVVAIVAAKFALNEYFDHSVYMCQPDRPFQTIDYIGFYSEGKINKHFAKVLGQVESMHFTKMSIRNSNLDKNTKDKFFNLIDSLEGKDDEERLNNYSKVFFLTPPNSPDTIKLKEDIINDTKSKTGKSIAFTQSQRYISTSKLKKNPKMTSDLI